MLKQLLISLFLCSSISCCFSQNTDIELLRKINLHRNKQYDQTFITISNSIAPVSIAVPVGVLTMGFIKHDSTIKNKGVYISASLLAAATITTSLKYSVNRQRPFKTYPDIDPAMPAGSPSFPSGHTSDAFATATSFSLAFPKWYVIAPSYLWACSVAYSRLDLGVHYPSDLLAGAIIGAGSSFLCYKANSWLHNNHHRK